MRVDSNVLLSSILKKDNNNPLILSAPEGSVSKGGSGKHVTITIPKKTKMMLIDDIYSEDKLTFVIEEDASLTYEFRLIKKSDIKTITKDLEFSCVGKGATVSVRCAVESIDDQVLQFKTIQHHSAPNTKSELVIKAVQHDRSRLISENLIRIEKGAHKVVAREENKNLLLGDHARVTTIPKLEVYADDVSCQHGAAISRISDDDIFYFQSRGIDRKTAEKALVMAFLGEGALTL